VRKAERNRSGQAWFTQQRKEVEEGVIVCQIGTVISTLSSQYDKHEEQR
jgi:hypothetical protein